MECVILNSMSLNEVTFYDKKDQDDVVNESLIGWNLY